MNGKVSITYFSGIFDLKILSRALRELRYAFKMATGSGKTWVMAMAVVEALQKRRAKAAAVGTVRSSVIAKAECAADVDDATATAILGIPAILLELIDSGDPAEIGNTVTYTVTVVNNGPAQATAAYFATPWVDACARCAVPKASIT